MNSRLGKAKSYSIRILLDSGASSLIVIGKHTQKIRNKMTQPFKWSSKGGDFLTTYETNVEFMLP